MGEDEKCPAVVATEDNVDGTFRYIDLANLLASRVVNKYLTIGYEDVAVTIDCDTLPAALGKRVKVAQRAVGADQGTIGTVF